MSKLEYEKLAKKMPCVFCRREREDDTTYDLEYLNENEYRRSSARYIDHEKELA
jgi:hypothetical protein